MNKEEYFYNQTVEGLSHEEDSDIWSQGQIRFLNLIIDKLKLNSSILDVGCGDGVGLSYLASMGHHASGLEISSEKIARVQAKGLNVVKCEMENITLADNSYDYIISSHSLEHSYDPIQALSEFKRVLRPEGEVFIVLPFPDLGDWNRHIHTAKGILKTDQEDFSKVLNFFEENKFNVINYFFDSYREPEIWLHLSISI